MSLKQELKRFAAGIGIDHLGVSSAAPFPAQKDLLDQAQASGTYPLFTEADTELRTNPQTILPDCRSIISVAVSYLTDDPAHPQRRDNQPRAWVSRYAWGEDYHSILHRQMEQLVSFLEERHPGAVCVPFTDTGPLVDRSVAQRAGLGWFGKNACIYVPGHGSWVFLGEILTNVPLEPDPKTTKSCGTCDKCVRSCPTGAIVAPFKVDPNLCLSQITQMGGYIPKEFRRAMRRRLFGCDVCQAVCPWNWEAQTTSDQRFRPSREVTSRPELIPLLTITKSEFRRRFGPTPMGWRGNKIIQRNACIVLGNIKDSQAVPALIDRLFNDVKPLIRGTAAWALGEIGGTKAHAALRQSLETEEDPEARSEIAEALRDL